MEHRLITKPEEVDSVDGTTRIFGREFHNTDMLKAASGASNIMLYRFGNDTRALAWWGVTALRLGAAELWIIPAADITRRERITMAFAARRAVVALLRSGRYFRLEMAVGECDRKWAEYLGFEFSHVCKRYDGENDQLIYVREA